MLPREDPPAMQVQFLEKLTPTEQEVAYHHYTHSDKSRALVLSWNLVFAG